MAAAALSFFKLPSHAATIASRLLGLGGAAGPAREQLLLERAAQRVRVVLQLLGVFDGPFPGGEDRIDDVLHARDALEGQSVEGLEHHRRPVAFGMNVVVRRGDVALLRVDDSRQFAPEAIPFVLAGARDGQPAEPPLAVRREGRALERDVAVNVAANQVLGGRLPVHGRLEERLAVARLREPEAAEIRAGPRFLHHRLDGVGATVLRVFMEDRGRGG